MEEGQFEDAQVEYIGLKFEKENRIVDYEEEQYDEYSDEGYDEDYLELKANESSVTSVKNFQPTEKLFKKFTNKINVDKYEGPTLSVLEQQNKKNDKVIFAYVFFY